MEKDEKIVEDNNVEDDSAVVGSAILGQSKLGDSANEEEVHKTNEQKLADLINENPGFPVIPLVDNKVVTDNMDGYYSGSIGDVFINDYFIAERDEIFFKDETLPWKSAIFIRVDEPVKE